MLAALKQKMWCRLIWNYIAHTLKKKLYTKIPVVVANPLSINIHNHNQLTFK